MSSVLPQNSKHALDQYLIFNAHAYSTSINQKDLRDADRKEIPSVLFDSELAASKNEKELTIFLSPRTDTKWLLELPGIRFKQLSYEEENQVSEYYELRDVKIHRDFIEVWLHKGNYCKKTGTGYQFRKERAKWKAQSLEPVNLLRAQEQPGYFPHRSIR